MLVLSRKEGERIVLPGCGVTITVVRLGGNRISIGVSAPASVTVRREELIDAPPQSSPTAPDVR